VTESIVELSMPRLSDSMEEGTIVSWLVEPGDRVAPGMPIVEVETDKATIVHECDIAGVLAEIVVDAGETAALGATIARVASADARPAATPAPAAVAPPPAPSRAQATPIARRLARELGIDLQAIAGTGPGGRIVQSDVRGATPVVPIAPVSAIATGGRGEVSELPLTPIRRTIAERMERSRREIPEFTVEAEIDMEACCALRDQLREAGFETVPSFNDLLVKAVALALRDAPALNGSYEEGRTLRFSRVNVGIAVATTDALLVPTVLDADARTVFEIARETRRLSGRVRDRTIEPDELAHGTFTVSNLGMLGVRRFTAIINHPQVAILAAGEIAAPRGTPGARRTMDVALSCDHRAVYGVEAATFLSRLRTLLEQPVALVAPGEETRSS
jgi:pyruvate dehydrogenase E2 component (dihydrolipoamide acetyltransferase)